MMTTHQEHIYFNQDKVLHELKHYLPAQAPLKDFVHHNTLHAFQHLKFETGTHLASEAFGYKTSLSLAEYREFYQTQHIREDVLDKILTQKKGQEAQLWKEKLIQGDYVDSSNPRIGTLRANWKKHFHIDLDSLVHPLLFRTLCSYLDQGIAIWKFPVWHKGFLASMKTMEKNGITSFFNTPRARNLLLHSHCEIEKLLKILVGEEGLFERYIYDQQFAHQGWSGMVSAIEDQPQTLLDHKKITLHELIQFELLLEIDAMDFAFGEIWAPLAHKVEGKPTPLFAKIEETELYEVLSLWQDALEWSYFDQVLVGIQQQQIENQEQEPKSFQAMFCIDDRECSIRRYIEKFDPKCETFGTPGFFNVEFFFKPEHGRFYTKLCPVPVTPKYLIKETDTKHKRKKDIHFSKHAHGLFRGFFITQTVGFWAAFRLLLSIFRPSLSPATSYSFRHMDKQSTLSIEHKGHHQHDHENGLQIGFTIEEMVIRVEGLLRSIGLVENFASIIYVIGHGASSVNNPHYAAYDCGACSGRPGSVNARVFCYMANNPHVRSLLKERGIEIPEETQFVGGVHDTTRDEIGFFDEQHLTISNIDLHQKNVPIFKKALDHNAKERSRRFELINSNSDVKKIHQKILNRSVSLFEPRPELNHATNALCVVGRRAMTKHIFLDRRSFLNSYDYNIDPKGDILSNVMRPLGPVCGGINLEYFFSRVDNQKFGAGTKLPHNVMGLFGVANGIEGDLRPGLPSQMIEVHDPLRLMIIVEHFPDVVLHVIKKEKAMYEWYINEWIHLVAIHPETRELYKFKDGRFQLYKPLNLDIQEIQELTPILETNQENCPVYII
jgi:uncharacterized protein